MVRIGVVNIDVSHPKAFSEYLKKENRARYVAVYNEGFRGDDEVEGFIKNYGLEKRCKSVEELADTVDIGFIQGCNWDKHLGYAMPFIERKKPVFIDKPMVGNLADCRKVEQLVKNGAVILGSSSVRYAEEIQAFLSIPESERGKIVTVFGTSGMDEFNYAIHVVEAIGGIMGTGAVSTRYAGRADVEGQACETFAIKFANGATGVYNAYLGVWQPFDMVVMTTKSTYHFRIEAGKVYGQLLDRICDYMETGKNRLAPVTTITESIRVMLAGRISRAQDGKEIKIADIPENDPGFDGTEFARGYAKAASKIYL
jgi:predicted dehydrogenase